MSEVIALTSDIEAHALRDDERLASLMPCVVPLIDFGLQYSELMGLPFDEFESLYREVLAYQKRKAEAIKGRR